MKSLQKFKKAGLGEIPEEWEIKSLQAVCREVTDGSHFSPEHVDSGFPLATVTNMRGNLIDIGSCYRISEEDYISLVKNGCKIEKEDVLFSKDGTIGLCLVYNQDTPIVALSSIAIIRPIKQLLYSNFAKYLLQSDYVLSKILGAKTGTALKRIILRDLRLIKMPIPKLQEQQKIASILSNVDELIQKIDQIIEQTQRLKKAIMQRLLTKGIGHTKFKKAGLGEIPEEWEIKNLEEVCNEVTDGSHFSPQHVHSGFPLATVANMKDNHIDVESCYKISEEDYNSLVKNGCKIEKGDILFSKDGTIGLCLVYSQETPIVVLSSIAIISPMKNVFYSYFAKYLLQSNFMLSSILGSKTGTALKRIVLRDLRRIKIPIPPLIEQQKIASILSNVDGIIQKHEANKSNIESLKKGLMQQLLTGKIRVKV